MELFDVKKIGSIRRRLGLTQTELARLAGVSQSLIAKTESGRVDPAYSKVKLIAEALDREMQRKDHNKLASDVMSKSITYIKSGEHVQKAIEIMKKNAISQLPVLGDDGVVGSLSDSKIADMIIEKGAMVPRMLVKDVMEEAFPSVPSNANLEVVANLLNFYRAVLVKDRKVLGIITKVDLIKAVER